MKKNQKRFWLFLSVIIVGFFIYHLANNTFMEPFMGCAPVHVKAVIIDEKNLADGEQPAASKLSYLYVFTVDGRLYKGNPDNNTLNVGDTVEIEYNKDHPNINKPYIAKN